MIRFDGVTKQFPDGTTAVDRLDLEIVEGAFTVFVGPSGCGKTTSMRMINRMIAPSSGRIEVDGRDVASVDAVALRRGIGYVIQSAGLLPHRTVVDNVATVPVLTGTSRRQARREAMAVLERVGLDASLATRYPAQLSGGQQQRVGVARALAADPPILLMDEPFSAVDPVVREDLQNEMLRLQADLEKTIVFVTHDIDEAVRLGDRIAVFGTGGVLQQYDTPDRVLSSPATDFVASFVGRDRGYRGLSFRDGSSVPLHPLSTTRAEAATEVRLEPSEWVLVVDEADRPRGWMDVTGLEGVRAGHSIDESTAAGGSLFPEGGDLRQALDAAISSPSGIGVAVRRDGSVLGGIDATEVLAVLAAQRGTEASERSRAFTESGPAAG
ncbi:ATP-binding cassette domain-containing protein [Rhodococcus kroppenstedtii]|uniref:ABC-type quaternary amine transporter n=1 Tax=Rhodococcoides kroppenstedtii TaxID=293050 RepID=A0A1I0SNJ0_9NOCA|nr:MULTISPECIES: ATP-binding cassette domain-containing protein [Rhodococcus]AMY19653.1 Choline transport ATP-binding protein OpuBA [Rhodococcus sp. PBTS 1]MBY6312230.1 ATP-binding cassette domain-containing protein [Rhodococcus kroppenstedtii]MBY6319686.1 ATP-binding cassette domain-containing protein [Rhodococcus kroppenstedtii]MBY6398369.1 ATP-binding cassette domain-containing protein [Rhodococcus kroppenstedtii]MBY6436048.1 ATP-binding cassette domain-containing protein [Rhodococcus kropp